MPNIKMESGLLHHVGSNFVLCSARWACVYSVGRVMIDDHSLS